MVAMFIVRKDEHGDLKWGEEIEVESLDAFCRERNEKLCRLLGRQEERYSVVSERLVVYRHPVGKVVETYHLCERNPGRLI